MKGNKTAKNLMIEIQQIPVLTDNYIYLIHDTESTETAVVDPTLAEPVLACLKQNGWQLNTILNTHHHGDHGGGARVAQNKWNIPVIANERTVQELNLDPMKNGKAKLSLRNMDSYTNNIILLFPQSSHVRILRDYWRRLKIYQKKPG